MAQLIYIPQIFPFESRKEQIFIRYRSTLGDLNIIVRDILLANFYQMVRMIAQSMKVLESTFIIIRDVFIAPTYSTSVQSIRDADV